MFFENPLPVATGCHQSEMCSKLPRYCKLAPVEETAASAANEESIVKKEEGED
jgi:hypothetical protein